VLIINSDSSNEKAPFDCANLRAALTTKTISGSEPFFILSKNDWYYSSVWYANIPNSTPFGFSCCSLLILVVKFIKFIDTKQHKVGIVY
jgi:hypothetical protein